MNEIIKPDRLFIALLEEWNDRHPGVEVLDPELQELIMRHMAWSRTISAECVINRLIRSIELTPCPANVIPVKGLIEIIRMIDPSDIDQLIKPIKRNYRLKYEGARVRGEFKDEKYKIIKTN